MPQSASKRNLTGGGEAREEESMSQYTETAGRSRLATYSKNLCPQCSGWLLAPNWSEYLNERCVRHTWSCETCGYDFETTVFFPVAERAAA